MSFTTSPDRLSHLNVLFSGDNPHRDQARARFVVDPQANELVLAHRFTVGRTKARQ